MIWHRINNQIRRQPSSGNYGSWRDEIALACGKQCVYCAISEARFGGQRNFHVEHFRPKSKFPDLINSIKNLYYACSICNGFKGDDWPGVPSLNGASIAYPDPGVLDYNSIMSSPLGQPLLLDSHRSDGRYIIERLYLNRPQLITERRLHNTLERLHDCQAATVQVLGQANEATKAALLDLAFEVITILRLIIQTPAYTRKEVTKPREKKRSA